MLVGLAMILLRMQATTVLVDDAYIFMRFARNIGLGRGVVWNPGAPPVEGYTSFSYVMLLVGAEKIGLPLPRFCELFGILCSLATLPLTLHLARKVNPTGGEENLVPVALLAVSPPWLYWAPAGMETPLFMLLLLTSSLTYLSFRAEGRRPWLVGLVFSVLALTRPEGIALFGAVVAYELADRVLHRRSISSADIVIMGLSFLGVYAPYFIWRYAYFGSLLPNTYYAKSGAGLEQVAGGIAYLKKTVHRFCWIPFACIAAATLVWVPLKRVFSRPAQAPAIPAALVVIIAILVGGDHFSHGRFVLPALPLIMVLLLGRGLAGVLDRWPCLRPVTGTAIIPLFLAFAFARWYENETYTDALTGLRGLIFETPVEPTTLVDKHTGVELRGDGFGSFEIMGQTLRAISSSDESLAAVPVGAIGYYSDRSIIDMVGIVDPVIAREPFDPAYTATWRPGHDKGNGSYILSRKPTYLQLYDFLTMEPVAAPNEYMLRFKSVVEIWNSPQFRRDYEFFPVRTNTGWYWNLYRRRLPTTGPG